MFRSNNVTYAFDINSTNAEIEEHTSYLWTYDLYGPVCNVFDAANQKHYIHTGPYQSEVHGSFMYMSSHGSFQGP